MADEALEVRLAHAAADLQPLDPARAKRALHSQRSSSGSRSRPNSTSSGRNVKSGTRAPAGGPRARDRRRRPPGAPRVLLAVETQGGERLGEGGQKADRIAHAYRMPAARRISGSSWPRASLSRPTTCGWQPQYLASTETAARTTGDLALDAASRRNGGGCPPDRADAATAWAPPSRPARARRWPGARPGGASRRGSARPCAEGFRRAASTAARSTRVTISGLSSSSAVDDRGARGARGTRAAACRPRDGDGGRDGGRRSRPRSRPARPSACGAGSAGSAARTRARS